MPTGPDYVKASEFARWMHEESEFRGRIEKRMGDGFTEIKASISRVEGLQRDANGRIGKAEKTIAVIERDLDAIKSEDNEIERTLKRIEKEGCHRYEAHREVLGVLDGANIEVEKAATPAFRLPALSPKQKAVAGIGVSALLIPAIAELFKLGTAFLAYLETHP